MNPNGWRSKTGTVIIIDDGCVIVRVCDRLVHVPQQALPAAAMGAEVAVDVGDWEFDARVLGVCLPPLLALAGALTLPVPVAGAVVGATLGALLMRLITHHRGAVAHHAGARA